MAHWLRDVSQKNWFSLLVHFILLGLIAVLIVGGLLRWWYIEFIRVFFDLLKGIAWPAAIIGIVFFFKSPLLSFLNAITELILDRELFKKLLDAKLGLGPASPEQREQKIREEINEVNSEDSPKKSKVLIDVHERVERYRLIERLAIQELSKKFNLQFQTGVRFQSKSGRMVIFDAYASLGNTIHVVEVRFCKTNLNIFINSFNRMLEVTEDLAMRAREANRFLKVYLVGVIEPSERSLDLNEIESKIRDKIKSYNFDVDIFLIKASALKEDGIVNVPKANFNTLMQTLKEKLPDDTATVNDPVIDPKEKE